MRYLLLPFLLLCTYSYSQQTDSITIKVNWGVESKELQDFYRFENIEYYNILAQGKELTGKNYTVIVKEYRNKKLTRTDTVVNTRRMKMPLKSGELAFRLMSKKTEADSVKILWLFSNFRIERKYKTTQSTAYSLRNVSNGKPVKHTLHKPLALFAYSLPYQDPKQPGWLLYCELSRESITPEKWGETFGIPHYLTMDLLFE